MKLRQKLAAWALRNITVEPGLELRYRGAHWVLEALELDRELVGYDKLRLLFRSSLAYTGFTDDYPDI